MFQWCSGVRMRFKKTEVCQTCSKLKNVCLTCLLGLEYGLPIQIQNSDGMRPVGLPGRAPGHNDMLLKLTRNMPYYKRIRLHICSFCMKGVCKRGEKCLYWNHFYQFGESHTITLVQRQQCTFIQFTTQHATEHAPGKSFNRLIINGCRLTVR